MHRRIISAAAAATLFSGLVVGAAPAFAADNCAAYGSQCPSVAPTTIATPDVKGTTLTKEPSSLPFTGGEFALMATAGVVALGGGTALVVVSRRRRTAA
ncbi:MAG: hypothetical protein QOI76_3962 [Frankiales bacterium]|jgi:hypothetical protein|nr:hypothetical protein [Frankiales bacterium]MDX6254878.1 hypothetical protein [Frankiales bacterium]